MLLRPIAVLTSLFLTACGSRPELVLNPITVILWVTGAKS